MIQQRQLLSFTVTHVPRTHCTLQRAAALCQLASLPLRLLPAGAHISMQKKKKKIVIKKKTKTHTHTAMHMAVCLFLSDFMEVHLYFLSRTQQKRWIVRPQFFPNSPSASIKRSGARTAEERLPLRLDRPGEEIKHRRHLVNFKTGHDAWASDRK